MITCHKQPILEVRPEPVLEAYPELKTMLERNKNHSGRKSVISETVVRLLEECFRCGLSVRSACQVGKISHDSFYRKVKEDKEFSDRIGAAKAFFSFKAGATLNKILEHGPGCRAKANVAMFILERTMPELYGKRRNLSVTLPPILNNCLPV